MALHIAPQYTHIHVHTQHFRASSVSVCLFLFLWIFYIVDILRSLTVSLAASLFLPVFLSLRTDSVAAHYSSLLSCHLSPSTGIFEFRSSSCCISSLSPGRAFNPKYIKNHSAAPRAAVSVLFICFHIEGDASQSLLEEVSNVFQNCDRRKQGNCFSLFSNRPKYWAILSPPPPDPSFVGGIIVLQEHYCQ